MGISTDQLRGYLDSANRALQWIETNHALLPLIPSIRCDTDEGDVLIHLGGYLDETWHETFCNFFAGLTAVRKQERSVMTYRTTDPTSRITFSWSVWRPVKQEESVGEEVTL